MERVRQAWADLWDRFAASDPGLIRLLNAANTVGALVLTLAVLAPFGLPLLLMAAGALVAMVSSFAISEPHLRDQAVTLAVALPTALASMTLAVRLAPHRVPADLVFVALIFAAVYVRRFGKRGTTLGLIAFQVFFISLFVRPASAQLPTMYLVLTAAFCCGAVVRFGILRVTPERTLTRLRHAFRARLAQVIDAAVDVIEAEPGRPAAKQAVAALHRQTGRLHACALMIQSRLDTGTQDARTAALIQRRVAEAEIAAERLGIHVLRAIRRDDTDHTLTLHLPGNLPVRDVPAAPSEGPDTAALRRLAGELRSLRVLVSALSSRRRGRGLAALQERLLGYRDDARLPDASPTVQEAFRGVGEFARALLGLHLVLDEDDDTTDDSPETSRSREELDAEDVSLAADEEDEDDLTGLARPSTRSAFQVAVGSSLAILGGELLAPQRWYWAVLTCWVVFINTSSTGEILVKGYRRLIGTVVGVFAGLGLAGLVGGEPWWAFCLVILCVFGMFFTAPLSYTLMSFFVTTMLGVLYTLLHTFSPAVLALRVEETALGALCGLFAAVLVLPVRTGSRTDEQLLDVLQRLREALSQAVAQLSGDTVPDLLDKARDLDTALDDLRSSVKPLTHPVSPLRARRRTARSIMGLLETCAYHARSLAATAELVPDSLRIGADPRLREAARRIDSNLAALVDHLESHGRRTSSLESGPNVAAALPTAAGGREGRPGGDTVAFRVLRHLQRLDEGILGLSRPLGVPVSDEAEPSRPERGGALSSGAS